MKLDLLWLEYQEARESARSAYARGNNLLALSLAIAAHKAKSRYEDELCRIYLHGVDNERTPVVD